MEISQGQDSNEVSEALASGLELNFKGAPKTSIIKMNNTVRQYFTSVPWTWQAILEPDRKGKTFLILILSLFKILIFCSSWIFKIDFDIFEILK